MNETIVTVVGNVASELRVRRFGPDDDRVVGFRIASSERRWDRENQSWTDGDRFSAWVSCWRRLAEGVVGSLVKGDPVVLTGRLSVREYESGGERRYSTEIVATAVGPDLARSTATVSRRRLTPVPGETAAEGPSEEPESDGPAVEEAGRDTPTTPEDGDSAPAVGSFPTRRDAGDCVEHLGSGAARSAAAG